MKRRVYKKVLTLAELGLTKTKEYYIRFSNDFDYIDFFQQEANYENGVDVIHFTALDLTEGKTCGKPVKLDFKHYVNNANKEKRIPSLNAFYAERNAEEEDIAIVESMTDDFGNTTFSIKIEKKENIRISPNAIFYTEFKDATKNDVDPIKPTEEDVVLDNKDYSYIAAIKTKPFLILGGFSGTGKSLQVKMLAYATCPAPSALSVSETSPGNYLLVSVKPNWHDATDITGFRSSVKNTYYVTDFMRFLVKAKQYPNVPFFVCLDEMNLAPVEEYFADFLSVIESRKKISDGTIVTDPLVPASVFNDTDYVDDFNIFLKLGLTPLKEVKDVADFNAEIKKNGNEAEFFDQNWIVNELKKNGLTIPQNVIIIGTVNMDDTTNTFSRKVIDRAMTFETVVGKFDDKYFDSDIALNYFKNHRKGELFISDEVRAVQMLENENDDFDLEDGEKTKIIDFINNINNDLDGTPFKISYRILNETILLYRSKTKIAEIMGEDFEEDVEFNTDLNTVFDDILMQKVLPRIEGDYEKCSGCLEKLLQRATNSDWNRSQKKIQFMIDRFGKDKSGFTSFWN